MEDDSPSTSRPKRQRIDKNGRFAALERLKKSKAGKATIDIGTLENVYDEVDEKEYLKTVSERQNSDWIVDDGGGGYVEDGREIFDDDLDDESIRKASANKLTGPRKRKREEPKSKSNIMSMFKNASSKKTSENEVKGSDDLLSNLLTELTTEPASPKPIKVNKFKVTPKPAPKAPQAQSPSSATDEFEIFDLPSPPVKKEIPKKTPSKQLDQSQIIENVDSPPKSGKKAPPLSQLVEEAYTQIDYDFDDSMHGDFEPPPEPPQSSREALKSNKKATETSPNSSVIMNDDFDFLIESIDESSFVAPIQKRPKIEDENFEDVISALDKEALWTDYELENTEISDSTTTQITSDQHLSSCITEKDGQTTLKFYWWDALENSFKTPGVVNLFGKIYVESLNSYVSSCVSVKNIPRRIYLLPREKLANEGRPTTMVDVYNEFNKYAEKHKILEFKSKQIVKRYAFNRKNTPVEAEYMEIRYSPKYPAMDPDYSGPAIEHVFGTSVNALELLLMERNIKGPSWLEIKSPVSVSNSMSWCKFQLHCLDMNDISVLRETETKLSIPPMVLATINVRTTLNSNNNNTEIAMIGLLVSNNYQVDKPSPKASYQQHYCFVTHPRDTPWPLYARSTLEKFPTTMVICETETDLLEKFLEKIHQLDPDLLVGYDCDFQFTTIYCRLLALRIKDWSRLGKFKHSITTAPSKLSSCWIIGGRPICDLLASAKELNVKVRSYDLDSICQAVLKTKPNMVKELKPADCPQFYTSADKISTLVKATMADARYILKLMFELNVIPLALQITCIAGNVLSRTLSAGRAERNEYLLLHAFSQKGYITPDKLTKKSNDVKTGGKKKPAYTGGLVLEPKRGFYDKLVLVMDFNSLYPSIIQEYNLCFTTIPGVCFLDEEDLKLPNKEAEMGVVPTEIRKLVESRKEVKNLMKAKNLSAEQKMQYNIRQLALKLTANSMYGCLGATHCRFYAKGLAALVTGKGRSILMQTKTLVDSLNHDVIYGDTDSLMINSGTLNYDEAFEIAKTIKQKVNIRYSKLELDIDGVFRYLLLLQKKKYAALVMNKTDGRVDYTTEYKGLDIVRRDWSSLASDMGRTVLDLIFVDSPEEEKVAKIQEKLQEVAHQVRNNLLPLKAFVIHKQLSKNPQEYSDKKMSHVMIAMRLNKAGGRMRRAGDTISYIICLDGTDRSPHERAYEIDEFKKCELLAIDCNYYLRYQILPVLQRICDPLQNVNLTFLELNLGLESTAKQAPQTSIGQSMMVKPEVVQDPYEDCDSFKFECHCGTTNEIRKPFIESEGKVKIPALDRCCNEDCDIKPWKERAMLLNELQSNLRALTRLYYTQRFKCNQPECQNKQKGVMSMNKKGLPICSKCGDGYLKKPLKESYFWNQMNFYRQIFDIGRKNDMASYPSQFYSLYDTLKEMVERYLKRNRYSELDFNSLCEIVAKIKAKRQTHNKPKTKVEESNWITPKPARRQAMKILGEENVAKCKKILETGSVEDIKAITVKWTLE